MAVMYLFWSVPGFFSQYDLNIQTLIKGFIKIFGLKTCLFIGIVREEYLVTILGYFFLFLRKNIIIG